MGWLRADSTNRFTWLHLEKLPSAVERYKNQTLRIMKVLDDALAASSNSSPSSSHAEDDKWLVGGKCSYADLSFVMYHVVIDLQTGGDGGEESMMKQFKHLWAWNQRLLQRPSVAKVCQMREDLMAKERFVVEPDKMREAADQMLANEAERTA